MFKKLILIYLSRLSDKEVQEVALKCMSALWTRNRDDLLQDIYDGGDFNVGD